MCRFHFVDDTRSDYPVKQVCEVLTIQRSWYYTWKNTADARQQRIIDDALLAARITSVCHANNGCYGPGRVTAELNNASESDAQRSKVTQDPEPVNHKRLARLMKANGLVGYQRRRRVKTTIADQRRRVFADLLRRRFTAQDKNHTYLGDITYLPIAKGRTCTWPR